MKNPKNRIGGNRLEALEGRRMLAVDQPYAAPTSPRIEINQNAGWKFAFAPGGTPQTPSFNDSTWADVSLPHTWNNLDAATTNYASGNGWYRKTINVDASLSGKKLYMDFEGAALATSLYVDGTQIDFKPSTSGADPHRGGFGEFLFDVTSQLTPGAHVIAVQVNNSGDSSFAPGNRGDYSKQGGLYRDVSLLALPTTRIARTENVTHARLAGADTVSSIATPGVYFTNSNVVLGATSASINVRTVLDNTKTTAQPLKVTSYLVDAAGVIRSETSTNLTLNPGQTGVTLNQAGAVANPHLWDGRADPYLYTLSVEIRDGNTNALLDTTKKKVGIRSFTINANASNDPNVAPFLLNGHRYTLVGANLHQDTGRPNASGQPAGWAQTDAQVRADVDMMLDMGATVIRTSHYQQNQALYDYADQVGMMIYTENSINGGVTNGDGFLANAQDQYQELIRQTQLNPSVFAWGFGNETSSSTAAVVAFNAMNDIAHNFDITRKTAFAQYGDSNSGVDNNGNKNLDAISDIKGTHRYDYWYINPAGASKVQQTLNAYPTQPLAITEYGGGASAYQYTDNVSIPTANHTGGVTTRYHPANEQALIEQMQITQYSSLNNLWGRIVWQMFDMGSSGKNEGDQGGVNDKGLGTRDRTLKDSYYYYQSIWNDPTRSYANKKVLEIGDRFWSVRNQASTKITVYSNLGAPTLFLNGASLGSMTPLVVNTVDGARTVANTYVMNLTLPAGQNTVSASRVYSDGLTYSKSTSITYRNPAAFTNGQLVASGVAVNRTFNYSPVTKTTSNPYEYALANGTYDVKITSPSGGVNNLSLEGQTATIDTNSHLTADTFYARVTVTDGSLTLAGARGGVSPAVSTMDIRLLDQTAPTVSGIVNNGATQRSKVNALGVTFSERVTLGTAAVSLGLKNPSGTGYSATYALTATNPSNDGLTYLLGLSDGTSLDTLGDGVYDLKVDASKVADASGNAMAAAYTLTFHRLFGDQNGDKGVDSVDALAFRSVQGKSSSDDGFIAYFDFNNDNMIDSLDSLQFRRRQGTVLSY